MKKSEPLRFFAIKAALSAAKSVGILFQNDFGAVLARGEAKALSSLAMALEESIQGDEDGEYIAIPMQKIDAAIQFAFTQTKKREAFSLPNDVRIGSSVLERVETFSRLNSFQYNVCFGSVI